MSESESSSSNTDGDSDDSDTDITDSGKDNSFFIFFIYKKNLLQTYKH